MDGFASIFIEAFKKGPTLEFSIRLKYEGVRMTQFSEETEANRVLTVEDITSLTKESGKPADTLMNVVALIAAHFRTDVCSAYLLEPDRSNLVLAATLGLHPRCIGPLRIPLHAGLSGLVG